MINQPSPQKTRTILFSGIGFASEHESQDLVIDSADVHIRR